MKQLPRILLLMAALVLAAGAAFHASVFQHSFARIPPSGLPEFYLHVYKAFWLLDSATLFILALVFAIIAIRTSRAHWLVVILLAFIPAATAGLIYFFVGSFGPAHFLAAAAAMVFVAGVLLSRTEDEKPIDPLLFQ